LAARLTETAATPNKVVVLCTWKLANRRAP
jgi:hypothetical protein